MRKFIFRFESLLKLRKRSYDEALRVLATAQQAYQNSIENKQALQNLLKEWLLKRELLAQNLTLSSVDYEVIQTWIKGTEYRIQVADQVILRAKRQVERALRLFLETRKKLRIMEKLRENDFISFKEAQKQKEEKELRDLYLMRHRLQSSNHEGEVLFG